MPGIKEWLLILLVVLIVFGAGKLRNIGGDLGAAVKSFKEGMRNPKKVIALAPRHAQRHVRALRSVSLYSGIPILLTPI